MMEKYFSEAEAIFCLSGTGFQGFCGKLSRKITKLIALLWDDQIAPLSRCAKTKVQRKNRIFHGTGLQLFVECIPTCCDELIHQTETIFWAGTKLRTKGLDVNFKALLLRTR